MNGERHDRWVIDTSLLRLRFASLFGSEPDLIVAYDNFDIICRLWGDE